MARNLFLASGHLYVVVQAGVTSGSVICNYL